MEKNKDFIKSQNVRFGRGNREIFYIIFIIINHFIEVSFAKSHIS